MEHLADLKALWEFFAVEPVLEDPKLPPFQNCITVETQVGEQRVWFTVVPWQNFGELRLVGKPFSVVKLVLSDISHLSIRKTNEDHYMLVRFARKQTSNLKLSLRPNVMLFWGNEAPEGDDSQDLQPV